MKVNAQKMTISVTIHLPLPLALDIGHIADEKAMDVSEWVVRKLGQVIDPQTGKERK